MSSPGKSDWSPSCPFALDASNTATPTLVVVPHAYPILSVRSATSVVVGSSVVAGSLLGGSYGAVHGIQAAMLILRAQALCAEGSSDPAMSCAATLGRAPRNGVFLVTVVCTWAAW
ncbi:GPI-anchored surface protein, putative [Bodo saltans]|uniref:GPI-anchored surface protein, putative n=1 Tax=Bodo saltans TaxID=75058 RepID=A0A0S4JJ43_BODSA|nr:GPI-anchored surface protein, putative [Bodo saltans]|eukprot:CUG90092.1 GPI-anchored surface protein, putative [Bodo saltans]